VQDYYVKDGKIIFTKDYHLKRGYCCGNFCLNCPYIPKGLKENTNTDPKKSNN